MCLRCCQKVPVVLKVFLTPAILAQTRTSGGHPTNQHSTNLHSTNLLQSHLARNESRQGRARRHRLRPSPASPGDAYRRFRRRMLRRSRWSIKTWTIPHSCSERVVRPGGPPGDPLKQKKRMILGSVTDLVIHLGTISSTNRQTHPRWFRRHTQSMRTLVP